MDKVLAFLKKHWQLLLAITLIVFAVIVMSTGVLSPVFAWIGTMFCGVLVGSDVTRRRGEQNTVAPKREEKIGETDDKGFTQVAVIETEAAAVVTKPEEVPAGVKPETIVSATTVNITTKPETTVTESASFFANKRERAKKTTTNDSVPTPPKPSKSPLKKRPPVVNTSVSSDQNDTTSIMLGAAVVSMSDNGHSSSDSGSSSSSSDSGSSSSGSSSD